MIVRTRAGGSAQLRSAGEFGSSAIPAPWMRGMQGFASAVGKRVSSSDAAALPAAMRAVRLKAETMAGMGLCFYRKNSVTKLEEEIEPSEDNWQAHLFETGPSIDHSAFDWLSDLAAGPEACGNSFALKTIGTGARGRREVVELIPLDPDYVRVRRGRSGDKLFDVHRDGRTHTYTSAEVFHVRGFTLNGQFSGLSPALAHAAALGYAIALEEYAGRYFRNDTSVGLVMTVPGNLTVRAAQRQLAIFEMSKAGSGNAHRPALVYNGTKLDRLGLGLRDSQYIEAQQWTVAQIARIYGVPVELLEGDSGASTGSARLSTEQLGLRFLTFGLFPSLRRFEDALRADADLGLAGQGIKARFDTRALLRVDAKTQSEVEHNEIQDGTSTRNEIRARRGSGPLPPNPDDPNEDPGSVIPVFPVGAGANPTTTPTGGE